MNASAGAGSGGAIFGGTRHASLGVLAQLVVYALRPARDVWRNISYNFHVKRTRALQVLVFNGAPNRIRTGVLALRGLCPGPLDDGSGECGSVARARYYRDPSRLLKLKAFT